MPNRFIIFFVWFPPLIIQAGYFSISPYFFYFLSFVSSVLYFLCNLKYIKINNRLLALSFFIFCLILYALGTRFSVFYWTLIVFTFLVWSFNNNLIPLRQYLFLSIVFSLLSFFDILYFIISNSFFISNRFPIEVYGVMPRYSFIFDEMSHFAFFLLPAATYFLINREKHYFLLVSIVILLTLSGSIYIIYFLSILFVLIYSKRINIRSAFLLITSFILVLFIFDYQSQILSKFSLFSSDLSGKINRSMLNNLFFFNIAPYIPIELILFGRGGDDLTTIYKSLIEYSNNYGFFYDIGFLSNDIQLFTLIDVFLSNGLILLGIVFLLYKNVISKLNPYYLTILFPFCLYGLKMSHSFEYFFYYFILFYLTSVIRFEDSPSY